MRELPKTLTVELVKGSYQRPAFLTDERGRIVCEIRGDQLAPDGVSIGEAERIARRIAALWNGATA